jgi:predicted transcriptional regulator
MDTYRHIISDFSNPIRIQILNDLHAESITFTELAKKFSISNSEVSRHITRLTEQGFIEKEIGSRRFLLTPFGETIIELYTPLSYIFRKAEYFRNHDLRELPTNLLNKIHYLTDCEFVEGTGHVMIKIEEFFTADLNSDIWTMTNQPFPFGKEGMNVRYIVNPEMVEFGKKIDYKSVNKSTAARLLPSITIACVILDRSKGMIFFSDITSKKPDFNYGFFTKKEGFGLQFIIKVWEYFWAKAEEITSL